MAKCVVCGADTSLFVNMVPLCPACGALQEAKRKQEESGEKPPPKRAYDKEGRSLGR